MADVGNALGSAAAENRLQLFDITFSWQKSATIRNRPISTLDLELDWRQNVVVDLSYWNREPQLLCPRIQQNGKSCGGELSDKGWAENAIPSKGMSNHIVYTSSFSRLCKHCCSEIQDIQPEMLAMLPSNILALLPVVVQSSEAPGLPVEFMNQLLSRIEALEKGLGRPCDVPSIIPSHQPISDRTLGRPKSEEDEGQRGHESRRLVPHWSLPASPCGADGKETSRREVNAAPSRQQQHPTEATPDESLKSVEGEDREDGAPRDEVVPGPEEEQLNIQMMCMRDSQATKLGLTEADAEAAASLVTLGGTSKSSSGEQPSFNQPSTDFYHPLCHPPSPLVTYVNILTPSCRPSATCSSN